jgi:hypothetical protein
VHQRRPWCERPRCEAGGARALPAGGRRRRGDLRVQRMAGGGVLVHEGRGAAQGGGRGARRMRGRQGCGARRIRGWQGASAQGSTACALKSALPENATAQYLVMAGKVWVGRVGGAPTALATFAALPTQSPGSTPGGWSRVMAGGFRGAALRDRNGSGVAERTPSRPDHLWAGRPSSWGLERRPRLSRLGALQAGAVGASAAPPGYRSSGTCSSASRYATMLSKVGLGRGGKREKKGRAD